MSTCSVSHCKLLGNTYHKDDNGKYMPIIVKGDPNKPRAKWNSPGASSKNANHEKTKPENKKRRGRLLL